GLGIAAVRRYIRREPRLEHGKSVDALILLVFFVILLSGFIVEGARIILTEDPWALWSPIGYLFGLGMAAIIPSTEGLRLVHVIFWPVHMLLWHLALAVAPWTKMAHVITSPLNIFFANLDHEKRSTVPAIDFDNEEAIEVLGI